MTEFSFKWTIPVVIYIRGPQLGHDEYRAVEELLLGRKNVLGKMCIDMTQCYFIYCTLIIVLFILYIHLLYVIAMQ